MPAARRRANHNCSTPGWGCGACADPAGGCYVGSWSTTDPALQAWTFSRALTMPGKYTVPNVGVGLVPPGQVIAPPLPPHSAFMSLEMDFDTPHSGNAVAVNVGVHGDLSTDWIFLDPATFGVEKVGNSGLCPFARFNPDDGHYYVAGGGGDIYLARSPNLTIGSWENPPAGPAIEQGCATRAEDCSPGSPVARIADGFYTGYWAAGDDHNDRDFLGNLTDWNFSVNDADVTFNGTHTLFIYGQCAQTAPKNFTGKSGNFYQLGVREGSELEWLASYYAP